MISPTTLYNFGISCKDSTMAGNVLRALCKQSVELNAAEQTMLDMIINDNEWMDDRIQASREKERKRKEAYRNSKSNVPHCPTDKTDETLVPSCPTDNADETLVPHPSSLPSSLPTSLPSSLNTDINRSVPVNARTRTREGNDGNGNGNGTEDILRNMGDKFLAELEQDESILFSGEYPTGIILAAIADDYKSMHRWNQLAKTKGEANVLQEVFDFHRELKAGEYVRNPAAVLNSRIGKLKNVDKKGGD